MNCRSILLVALLATPAAAQTRPIAPAASVAFQASSVDAVVDTVKVDTGIPQPLGRFLGLIGGAGVGYLLSRINEGRSATYDCALSCQPPYRPTGHRVVSAAIFGLLGMWVGGELTGPKAPKS